MGRFTRLRQLRFVTSIGLLIILVVITNIFARENRAYAQGSICEDRPANDRSTPPGTVWVEVVGNYEDFGEIAPFARDFSFDSYVSGVLLGELGDSPGDITGANLPSNNGVWDDTTLEALAIAIRSVTWFRLNFAGQFSQAGADPHPITLDNTNQCGFWDEHIVNGQQLNAHIFRPLQPGISQTIRDHYANIVTQNIPNIYLVSGTGTWPIHAIFRDTVGEQSAASTENYLASIADPISAGDYIGPNVHAGMAQWGSQRWAMGLNDAEEDFPLWESYQQILTHYFTDAHLRVANSNLLTPIYRWNPLEVDWGGGAFNPPVMQPGSKYPVEINVQNTGLGWTNTNFHLSCLWRKPDNTLEPCSTFIHPDTLNPGANNIVTLNVIPPSNFSPGTYTLLIDMKTGSQYFNDGEVGRPWFTLDYPVTIVAPIERFVYLPIALKAPEGSPPPPPDPSPDCTATQEINLTNRNFNAGLFGWDVNIPPNKPNFTPDELHSFNYKDPTDSLGVARLGGVDTNHNPGDTIDMRIQQEFDVPTINTGETLWLDIQYSYCIDTTEPSGEHDEFWAEIRTFDAAGVVGTGIRYTNLNRTDPEHENCNPLDQRNVETGWRQRDNPQDTLNAYYTKNLVKDGKYWVNATQYAGEPLIVLFRAEVNNNNPTNFYIDNLKILYCTES